MKVTLSLLVTVLVVGSMAMAFCLNENQSHISEIAITLQVIVFLGVIIYLVNQTWNAFRKPYGVFLGISALFMMLTILSIGLLNDGPLGTIFAIAAIALLLSALFVTLARSSRKHYPREEVVNPETQEREIEAPSSRWIATLTPNSGEEE